MATRSAVKAAPAKTITARTGPQLDVSPETFFREFVPLLALDRARAHSELAAGLGSTDVNKPQRATRRFVDAAELFGIAKESDGGFALTGRGRTTLYGGDRQAAALRRSFCFEPIPREIVAFLTAPIAREIFARRLQSVGRENEATFWLQWLETANIVKMDGETITMLSDPMSPGLALDEDLLAVAEEVVYRRNQMLAEILNSDAITRLRAQMEVLRNGSPSDAESTMHGIVRDALAMFGFSVQTRNGPRDGDGDGRRLRFGAKGDDVVALYVSEGIAASSSLWGWALGIELKRRYVDKKAVLQATAACDRVHEYYGEKVNVMPIIISGEQHFADQAGREYAEAQRVVHVPIAALVELAEEQHSRTLGGKRLIVATDILGAIHIWRRGAAYAPTTEDVLRDVLAPVKARDD
jgi:hypothetical protein